LYKSYHDAAPTAELDVVCVSDGKFIIGEVKNSGKLFKSSEFKRIQELAKVIRPDKIIMYALKPPYGHVTKLTEQLKSDLSYLHIDVEFMHAPNSFDDPVYHI